jgi:SynChlorMet cassette protein ScmD
MTKQDKPVANPNIQLREEFDDWAILFDVNTGQAFGLNPIGVSIWKLLDGKHALDGLLEQIHHRMAGVPKEASDHVAAFVDDLVSQGLASLDSTACHLLDTLLHLEKSFVLAGRFNASEGGEDANVCVTDKKIAYENPRVIDFASNHLPCTRTGADTVCGS